MKYHDSENSETHILAILDRSGSMSPLAQDTIGGFNGFLENQKDVDGRARLTTVLFDHEYRTLDRNVPLEKATKLDSQNYVPRGSTALLDAIGHGIGRLKEADPDKAVIFIYTDGKENSSNEWTVEDVEELVDECKDRDWRVIFGAADLSAVAQAEAISVDPNFQTVTGRTSSGVTSFYSSTSTMTTNYRTNSDSKQQENGERTKN